MPVVINKWASWCGPCREEFPDFQTQAIERGDEIAFLGLLSNDGPETGETFLTGLPLPYPSYLDSDQDIAGDLGISREFPTTVIIGSDGEIAYTKYGQYPDEEALAADIQEYAQLMAAARKTVWNVVRWPLAAIAVIVFGAGVPYLWVWVGSQLQGGTAPSFSGLGVALLGIIIS